MKEHYDVIIVGARCAGAATAMLLARRGLRVLAIDKSRSGTDTLSTHAMMRGGVLQLARWGVPPAVRESGAPPIETTTFQYGDEATTIRIKPRDGVDALYAPRRMVLDQLLADAASDSGAELSFGTSMESLLRDRSGRVTGAVVRKEGRQHEIRADLVIGADGTRSRVAEMVGARTLRQAQNASATVYGYYLDLDLDGYRWFYAPGAAVGTIPTNGGHCVFATMRPSRLRAAGVGVSDCFDEVIGTGAPSIRGELRRAHRVGGLRRFFGIQGWMRQPWGPGWALVGDAGYFKDPLTAHGMTDALRDAELLARAVVRGGDQALSDYHQVRDELSADFFGLTDAVASFDWTLGRLAEHHLALNEAMKREVMALTQLDTTTDRAA